MAKESPSLPDISEDLLKYQELNPAYSNLAGKSDQRALDDINNSKFKKGTSEELNFKEKVRRIEMFRTAIRAKIEQMEGNVTWREKGGSTDQEFRSAPRTFVKTVQEVLSHPTERMVFQRSDDFFDGLKDIIIDPRRITNTLLANLGLEEYIPPKGTLQQKQLELRALAIPEIRENFRDLEPIILPGQEHDQGDLKYFRLMRIGAGSKRGYIIGTQHIDGDKILFQTDLYGAGRRLLHIEQSYAEEIRKLKWIEMVLNEIYAKLDNWSDVKNTKELDAIRDSLEECVKSLEFVRDEHKKRLLERIKRCLALRGKDGRLNNPSAKRAAIKAAVGDTGKRFKDIENIWAHVGKDKARVRGLIEQQERPFDEFCAEVRKLHDRFRILQENPSLDDAEKDRIIRNLKERQKNVSHLVFEPYLSFGEKFTEQINKVIAALGDNDIPRAATEFIKVYLITKLVETHNDLQKVYEDLSLYSDKLHPETLLSEIKAINGRLSSHDVAPGIATKEYDDAYGEVYHLFNSLKKRLKKLFNGEVNEDEMQTKKESKTTLDDILDRIKAKAPRLTEFVARIKDGILSYFARFQKKSFEVPKAETPYTPPQKEQTFKEMKQIIGEFDFRELIAGLR